MNEFIDYLIVVQDSLRIRSQAYASTPPISLYDAEQKGQVEGRLLQITQIIGWLKKMEGGSDDGNSVSQSAA